ncbi:MAG TPA: universal stress protein [Solirubrobacteraceae bacterium]|nr:universal stress protein [Solirubrobacteraceae bacterium]
MILIGYDGSDDARAAIAHAGALMPGSAATVLTVWEALLTQLTHTPAGLGPVTGFADLEKVDRATAEHARQRAQEGVELARTAGLDATAATTERHGTIADAILDEAERIDAGAIVLGSRGLTGIGSLLLGSVSHAVVQRADRTVIVVPSPSVAARRHDRHHDHAGTQQAAGPASAA